MQLLGVYNSEIYSTYYNELIALVNSAISKGDYAGGFTFDQTAINALKAQDSTFANLTLPSAGTRSIDEDFNNPLNLLQARFAATTQELNSLISNITNLITIIEKDTTLLDQLLYRAQLNNWLSTIPSVLGSTKFSLSFGSGFGKVGFNLSNIDPNNNVVYSQNPRSLKYYDLSANIDSFGIVPAATTTIYTPTNLVWNYDTLGFEEETEGVDWAGLSFLEYDLLISYNTPQVDVILPDNTLSGPFVVTGNSVMNGIPIYIRTQFTPRNFSGPLNSGLNTYPSSHAFPIYPGDQVSVSAGITAAPGTNGSCSLYLEYLDQNSITIVDSMNNPIKTLIGSLTTTGTLNNVVTTSSQSNVAYCKLVIIQNNVTVGSYTFTSTVTVKTPIRLTNGYTIDPTSVYVFTGTTYYNLNEDFVVNGQGYLTLINVPDNTPLTVSFVEYFPSYQCSINNSNWSQTIMFDYQRPYPDSNTVFNPIPMGVDSNGQRNQLPIIDESGNATGLYIALADIMQGQYLLRVYQDADKYNIGKPASLNISFGAPNYMNCLNLSSYTNFPIIITGITCQGFAANTTQTLFTGSYYLDRPTSFRFPTTLISSVTVSFLQQNYTIKQHQIIPDDYLRREAINDLQGIIPINAQESDILPETLFVDGFQYEFGIENISGVNETPVLPTVFISGPYKVTGQSNTITLFADYSGSVSFYICHNSFNSNDTNIDSNELGTSITPGTTMIFPFTPGLTLANVSNTDIYLKIVLRSPDANVSNFLLQVD